MQIKDKFAFIGLMSNFNSKQPVKYIDIYESTFVTFSVDYIVYSLRKNFKNNLMLH